MKLGKFGIELSLDNNENVIQKENIISVNEKEYFLDFINPNFKYSKGGNSSVFIAKDDDDEYVIKISNYYRPSRNTKKEIKRRYGRFITEIDALYKAKNEGFKNVIEIIDDGEIELEGKRFPFYLMEKANTDLKESLLFFNNEFDIQEKLAFCKSLFSAIKQLHSIGIYHRDIKPDNVFMFELWDDKYGDKKFYWKIGDLGLIAERGKDYDDLGERIGPFGWISPEAMNKYLTEKANLGFDCTIDEKSDIFQLGELFWFIFKLNSPIGQIYEDDLKLEGVNNRGLFKLIFSMMTHSKGKRLNLEQVEKELEYLINSI